MVSQAFDCLFQMPSFSGIHSPEPVGRPVSVPFPIQLRFPSLPSSGAYRIEAGGESLSICFPGCPCSMQRASGSAVWPPSLFFQGWASQARRPREASRRLPGPAHCTTQAVPPDPAPSGARFGPFRPCHSGPELWSSLGPEIQPHPGASLLLQTRKYKAFIRLLFLNKGA